jgi:SAM-dependent methyltransferase
MPTETPEEALMLSPKVSQRHLAVLLNTMLKHERFPATVRVLDMGCGDAHMLAYLAHQLPAWNPDHTFEFYGFEVGDIGWRGDGYLTPTIDFLSQHAPGHQWQDRVAVSSALDRWPYEPASFEVIISNQVLEHVRDHALVFAEIRRCLAPNGVSVHLFPVREVLWEAHAHMPLVHKVRNPSRRERLMLFFAKLGFTSKYKDELPLYGWRSLQEFAAKYSDILGRMTNYLSSGEIKKLANSAGLRVDFSYTTNFFSTKLLSMMRRTPELYGSPTWVDKVVFLALKRVASVTLILR